MRNLLPWIGPVVFAALIVNFAVGYGKEWEFGRLGMPDTLLAADGEHYPNGEEVDPMTLAMARSGTRM